jgi:hypothetical protein
LNVRRCYPCLVNEPDEVSPMVWELRRGKELLATITVTDQDFPWSSGLFTAAESFEPFRHFFVVHADRASAETARAELQRQGVVLLPSGGRPVREFVLQVHGPEAGFKFV